MTFSDLKGIKKKKVGGMIVRRNVTAIISGLRKYRVCAAAGDEGCITVWRRDDGDIGADFQRYMVPRDEQVFKCVAALKPWIKKLLPRVEMYPW